MVPQSAPVLELRHRSRALAHLRFRFTTQRRGMPAHPKRSRSRQVRRSARTRQDAPSIGLGACRRCRRRPCVVSVRAPQMVGRDSAGAARRSPRGYAALQAPRRQDVDLLRRMLGGISCRSIVSRAPTRVRGGLTSRLRFGRLSLPESDSTSRATTPAVPLEARRLHSLRPYLLPLPRAAAAEPARGIQSTHTVMLNRRAGPLLNSA